MTVMFSERCKGIGDGAANYVDPVKPITAVYNIGDNPIAAPATSFTQQYYNDCKAAPAGTGGFVPNAMAPGRYWWAGNVTIGRFSTIMTPNSWSCNENNDNNGGAITASSRHSGGVNVLMGDGSVKFVKDTISPQTWWAVGTRAGGEAVSADQL